MNNEIIDFNQDLSCAQKLVDYYQDLSYVQNFACNAIIDIMTITTFMHSQSKIEHLVRYSIQALELVKDLSSDQINKLNNIITFYSA